MLCFGLLCSIVLRCGARVGDLARLLSDDRIVICTGTLQVCVFSLDQIIGEHRGKGRNVRREEDA